MSSYRTRVGKVAGFLKPLDSKGEIGYKPPPRHQPEREE
jgi:hypothetical protein